MKQEIEVTNMGRFDLTAKLQRSLEQARTVNGKGVSVNLTEKELDVLCAFLERRATVTHLPGRVGWS